MLRSVMSSDVRMITIAPEVPDTDTNREVEGAGEGWAGKLQAGPMTVLEGGKGSDHRSGFGDTEEGQWLEMVGAREG